MNISQSMDLKFVIGESAAVESATIELGFVCADDVSAYNDKYDLDIGHGYLDKVLILKKISFSDEYGFDHLDDLMDNACRFADSHNFVIIGKVNSGGYMSTQASMFYTRHGFERSRHADDCSYVILRY